MFRKIKEFLFTNTTARQTVAKNTFWLSVAHVGGRMLRAIIIIYAARVLGATEWGVFNYAVTLVAFLTLFVDLGISNILTRETARHEDPEHRLRFLSTSFVLKAGLIILGVLVVIFVAPWFTKIEAAKALFPIVAFILVFDALREFGFAYLRAMEKMEWEALLSLAMNVAIVIAGFTFLAIRTDVVSFTYAYAFGTGIGLLLTIYLLRDKVRQFTKRFTPSLIPHIVSSAWPFAVSGVLGMLTLNTDVVVIGWLRTSTELGYYSAGQRLIQLLYVLPTIISLSVLPTFARTAHTDNARFRQILERIVSMMFLVAIPIVVGGLIVGGQLLTFIFGPGYGEGVLSFKLLLLTLLIDFPAVVLSSAVFAYDRQKNLILYAGIGGVLNIVLDIILIRRYGIEGSAIATVVAQLAANIYLWYILKRINPFVILPRLKRVVVAAALMGVVTFVLVQSALHVVGVILLAIPVYVGYLYFAKEPLIMEIRETLRPAVPHEDSDTSALISEEAHRRTH